MSLVNERTSGDIIRDKVAAIMFNCRCGTRIHNYRGRCKLPGSNIIKRHGKSIFLCGFLVTIFFIIVHCQKIRRLSRYKDLSLAKAEVLNYALKRLPNIDETQDTWKIPRVDGAAIFSAYLDTRPEVVLEEDSNLVTNETAWAMIRIIGVIPVNRESTKPMCYYKYRDKMAPNETHVIGKRAMAVHLLAFNENFGMKYCAAFVLCELPGRDNLINDFSLPREITITSEVDDHPENMAVDEFVVIKYPKKGWRSKKNNNHNDDEKNDRSIAVCVQPFHHHYDRAIDLVAFVEYYREIGVRRFTFYRHSTSTEIDEILDYYASENIAKIVEWRLPKIYIFEINLRVDGIFAALNDCVYRSTFHDYHRYVVAVDVDEYIVPREHENLDRLMDHLDPPIDDDRDYRDEENTNGAWIFRNMFFYLMHRDDSSTLAPGLPKLNLHTKTQRWREVNQACDRSKLIVRGRDVIDLGNHQVWKMKKTWSLFYARYRQIIVDPEIAASQHYRKCETTVEKCWKRKTILDRTAHRFTDRLAHRVARTMKTIFSKPFDQSAKK